MSALENANLRIDALLARVEALEARVNQPQG
jgi:BMFP domain-containing protein YqiC